MILAAAAVLTLGSLNLNAQAPGSQIVFVDSQAAINAHPAGSAARAVEEQGRIELEDIRKEIDSIAQRARAGQDIGPEEQETYQVLLTTYDSIMNRIMNEAGTAAQPAVEAIDRTLRELSAEFGYTLVLDQTVAAGSGLVVFAAEGLDITELVISRITQ